MSRPFSLGGSFPDQSLGRMQRWGYIKQTAIGTKPTGNLASTQEVKILEGNCAETKERPERLDKRPTLSLLERFDGKRGVTWQFTGYLLPDGTAGNAPDVGEMLDAAGFAEVNTPGVRQRYTPDSILEAMLITNDTEGIGQYVHDAIVNKLMFAWDGGDACKLTVEGIGSYKSQAGVTQTDGAFVITDTVIAVDDAGVIEVDSYVQFATDAGGSNAGYRVTARDTGLNTITISPGLATNVADNTAVGPIFNTLTALGDTNGNPIDGNSGSVTFAVGSPFEFTLPTVSGSVTVDMTIADNRDDFGDDKYSAVYYERRRVTGEITCKLTKAQQAVLFLGRDNTQTDIRITLGDNAGKTCEITIPFAELNPPESADIPEEGAVMLTFSFVALGTTGDNEVQIDFE